MTYIYRPVDGSLIFYLHPDGSRRGDSKANNLARNPDSRLFPSLYLDGVDDYVNCGNPSNLNFGTGDFSVEFWIYPLKLGSQWVLSKNSTQFAIQAYSSGNSYLYLGSASHYVSGEFSPFGAPLDHWRHVIIVRNTTGGYIKWYYNGQDVTAGTTGSPLTQNISSVANLLLGVSGSTFLNAHLKGFRIYNRALLPVEILSRYKDEAIGQTGLVANYIGDGHGSTLTDYSGNANHGTIYGAVWQDGKTNGTLSGGVTYKNSPSGNPVYNFDGTGYIRVTPVRSARNNMSVFTWARSPEESYLLGRYDTGLSDRSWIIGTDVSGEKRLRVLLSDDGTYGSSHSKDYLTTANVFDNQWHLYGFTWNSGTLKLFVDGREQSVTKTYDASFTTLKATSTDLIIGARLINGAPSAFLTGQQGHQWIFNKTLPTSEAMQLFNETRGYYGR